MVPEHPGVCGVGVLNGTGLDWIGSALGRRRRGKWAFIVCCSIGVFFFFGFGFFVLSGRGNGSRYPLDWVRTYPTIITP